MCIRDRGTAHAVKPAVANMSIGGEGQSEAMQIALDASVASGVTYAVAAGNETDDACNHSPAFVPAAIILIAVALVAFYAYQQVAEDLANRSNSVLIEVVGHTVLLCDRKYLEGKGDIAF